jgi:hypothetical protein
LKTLDGKPLKGSSPILPSAKKADPLIEAARDLVRSNARNTP